jgi:hypothetical protein
MSKQKYITKSQIRKRTGAKGSLIDYLYESNKLPVIQESEGKGYSRKYSPEAIEIVKDHLARRNNEN